MTSRIFTKQKKNIESQWEKYWTRSNPIEILISWVKINWGYKKLLSPFYFKDVESSLELGAGKAYLSRILKKQVKHTICIDNDLDIITSVRKEEMIAKETFVEKYYLGDMFLCEFPKTDLTLSCGVIEHFKIKQLKKITKKIHSLYILMFYPSCDWKWRLLWKLRGIRLNHYQHNAQDLKKVFGKYKTTFGYINFFGLHYNYIYGVKCQ